MILYCTGIYPLKPLNLHKSGALSFSEVLSIIFILSNLFVIIQIYLSCYS